MDSVMKGLMGQCPRQNFGDRTAPFLSVFCGDNNLCLEMELHNHKCYENRSKFVINDSAIRLMPVLSVHN